MFDKIVMSMSLKDGFLLAGKGGVSLKKIVGGNNENMIIVKICAINEGEVSGINEMMVQHKVCHINS